MLQLNFGEKILFIIKKGETVIPFHPDFTVFIKLS